MTLQWLRQNTNQILNTQNNPIARPNGRAMVFFLWGIRRKLTALYDIALYIGFIIEITSLRYFVMNMIVQTQLSPASLTLWLKVRLKLITSHAIHQSAFHAYNPIINEVFQYGLLYSDTSYCYSVRIVFMRRRNIRDKTYANISNEFVSTKMNV